MRTILSSWIRRDRLVFVRVLAVLMPAFAAQAEVFYQPKDYSRVAYGLTVDPATADLRVTVGGQAYLVASRFSRPARAGLAPLPPSGTQKASLAQSVVNYATPQYTLRRVITAFPSHIAVADTFTNLTDELIGVRFAHSICVQPEDSTTSDTASTVGGFYHAPAVMKNPQRPFVHVVRAGTSLGMVMRDDVSRNQVECYGEKGRFGARDDYFGLASKASWTVKWELYPRDSGDYYDFINAVRAVWGTAGQTIPYLFAFIPSNGVWPPNDPARQKTLEKMTVEDMKRWLAVNKIGAVCFVITMEDEKGTPTIEAFGTDFFAPGARRISGAQSSSGCARPSQTSSIAPTFART